MLNRSRNRTPTLAREISLPQNVYQTKYRRDLRCIFSNRLQILSDHPERNQQGRARPAGALSRTRANDARSDQRCVRAQRRCPYVAQRCAALQGQEGPRRLLARYGPLRDLGRLEPHLLPGARAVGEPSLGVPALRGELLLGLARPTLPEALTSPGCMSYMPERNRSMA